MEQVSLKATVRKKTKKGYAHKLRRRGFIPAVLYGHKEEPILLEVEKKSLLKALSTEAGDKVIINLNIEDNGKQSTRTTIMKEKQTHFTTQEIIHVDFLHISMDEKIEISIPVHLTGEAKGVKEGGILEQSLWELEIKCLPTEILDSIDVDISDLGINETIYVKDIPLKEGIELLTDEELPVATIRAMIEVPEEEVVEEEIAAPEVITEKKREEEEEEEE